MIRKRIYFYHLVENDGEVMNLELDIKAIRFSLISYPEDLYGLIVIKLKNNNYKHMRIVLDSLRLSHIFKLDHFKKCIRRSDIIKMLNTLSNTDKFLFMASKQYYRQKTYAGSINVYMREIEV